MNERFIVIKEINVRDFYLIDLVARLSASGSYVHSFILSQRSTRLSLKLLLINQKDHEEMN